MVPKFHWSFEKEMIPRHKLKLLQVGDYLKRDDVDDVVLEIIDKNFVGGQYTFKLFRPVSAGGLLHGTWWTETQVVNALTIEKMLYEPNIIPLKGV